MLFICARFDLWDRFCNSLRIGEKHRVLPYHEMEMTSNANPNGPCPCAKDGCAVHFGDEQTWASLH